MNSRLVRSILGLAVLMASFASACFAAQTFNYITAQDLKKQMDAGTAPMIVDVQSERDYGRGHLPDAIATKAHPVNTPAQREQLKPLVSQILGSPKNVVIVCPAGTDAAENAYAYLKAQGVPEERMAILKGGQSKYPYFNVVRDK